MIERGRGAGEMGGEMRERSEGIGKGKGGDRREKRRRGAGEER